MAIKNDNVVTSMLRMQQHIGREKKKKKKTTEIWWQYQESASEIHSLTFSQQGENNRQKELKLCLRNATVWI